MSREIKFRAWNEKTKRFTKDSDNAYLSRNDSGIICEQSTGLKDKNGKEIHEGDILREYDEGLSNVGKVEWDEHNAGFCVVWSMYNIDTLEEGQFTVIGNIHENPGLLEEAK